MNARTSVRVQEIRRLLADADALDADIDQRKAARDSLRWQAAEHIAAELDAGKKQAQLAEQVGISQSTVSKYAAVWRTHGADYSQGILTAPFDRLVKQVARKPRTPKPVEQTVNLGALDNLEITDRLLKLSFRMTDASESVRGDSPDVHAYRRAVENLRLLAAGEDIKRSLHHLMDALTELAPYIGGHR